MTTIIRIQRLLWLLLVGVSLPLQADTASLTQTGHESVELSPPLTDLVRENLLHIFDSSDFHQMQGGALPVKTQKQIGEQLKRVEAGANIELQLDEAARIVVEGTVLKAIRMWVSIRESDGFVYDWILLQPSGDLVSLTKAKGELVVQFAPTVLHLLKQISEQGTAPNP